LTHLVRRFLPRRKHPLLDAPIERTAADVRNELRYVGLLSDQSDDFLRARYAEGVRWRQVLGSYVAAPARLLDLGAGNGAVELAMQGGGYSVVSVDAGESLRYRLLETMRVFALEQLDAAGETAAWRTRHARAVSDLFAHIDESRFGDHGTASAGEVTERLRPEMDNARAALHWCSSTTASSNSQA